MFLKRALFVEFLAVTSFVTIGTKGVAANWFGRSASEETEAVSLNELGSFWIESSDIIADLESYEKIWIKPHSCVWTECAIDDVDDGYMGDNRDGDGQWYQYRTQGFCANAAYSLYGQKAGEGIFTSLFGCSRQHYINSFFTYGGADILLKSVGQTPVVFDFDGDGNEDNHDNNNNDDGYGSSANAVCTEIEYDTGDDDANNEEEEEAQSQSGSNDNDGYSATLGCTSDGEYVIAAFHSSSCDGNYYAGIVDAFEDYNAQHKSIGCYNIYQSGNEVSVENIVALLSNSWSCDFRLYPNGCPDPYGEKEKYDFAMRTVAHGGNPDRAYQNMVLKRPFRVTSWVLFAMTVAIFIFTYLVKNELRAIESKGGRNVLGYLKCLGEDIMIFCRVCWDWLVVKCGFKTADAKANDVSKDAEDTDESEGSYVTINDDGTEKIRTRLERNTSRSVRSPRSSEESGSAGLLKDEEMARSGTWT